MADRQHGRVKWYNPEKGYGFIVPESGDKDVFVHKKDIVPEVLLRDGMAVSYVVGNGPRGAKAYEVRPL
jgi:CspA family cold shock protein